LKKKHFIAGICGLILSLMIIYFSPVSVYLSSVRMQESIPVFSDQTQLRAQISREAPLHEFKPIDARNDRIWRLIPGMDGQVVNQAKTLQKTVMQKSKSIQWVYQSVKPTVNLSDLGLGPIYRGNEQQKAVALMVNVAWGTEHLSKMLEICKQEQVLVTFFVDGSWLNKHRQEGLMLEKAGHEIGNHGYTHPLMSQVTEDRMAREIGRTEEVIKQVYRHPSRWFAPPAGDYNAKVIRVADQFYLGTILWTVDTIDWRKSTTPTSMVQKISSQVEAGNLILMHPTDRTVIALPGIIKAIKQKGLALTTVSDLLSTKRINPLRLHN
jgi:probable sporulation protein (polysaccharide deacetylase family)